MKSEWQLNREKEARLRRNLLRAGYALVICSVLILQSIAHGMPSNLDELVDSPSAIGRLQEANYAP